MSYTHSPSILSLVPGTHTHIDNKQTQMIGDNGQSTDSFVDRIREFISKMSWKHAIIGLLPLVLYIYPTPILKPFVMIASKLNRNHRGVACHDFVHEIILTTNPAVNAQNLSHIETLRGVRPNWSSYREDERAVIEMFLRQNRVGLFNSHSLVLSDEKQSEFMLFGESLWTNYRLTRLENPRVKAILIKASEQMVKGFLLRFYKMEREQSHKMGFFTQNKLTILRLDDRVGTYQHLTCEFTPIRVEPRLK